MHVAAEFFGLEDVELIRSKRRRGQISHARYALAHVLIEDAGWSTLQVGRLINKDHSAVVLGRRKAGMLLRHDPVFFGALEHLREAM